MKLYAKAASQTSSVDHEAENRRLKRELARMTEERDILKNRSGLGPACAR
jgi:transposase